jgi:hypothetical protein
LFVARHLYLCRIDNRNDATGERMSLSTKILFHDRIRTISCCLCGRDWEEHWTTVALYAHGKKLGGMCPDCLQRQPRGVAARLRASSAQLAQALLDVNQATGAPGESSEMSMQVAHVRAACMRLCAAAKRFLDKTGKQPQALAEDRAVLQKDIGVSIQRRRLPKPGSADQIPLPSILTEHVEQAAMETTVLRTVAERLEQSGDWTTTLDKMMAAEERSQKLRFPRQGTAAARNAVRERYERFLLENG